jgi:hypothetical protein
MRLQLPEGTQSEVVQAASILEAATQMRLPEAKRIFQEPTVCRGKPTKNKPVLVFYLFNHGNHPLACLMLELLLRMFDSDKVEIYILILRKANRREYAPFIRAERAISEGKALGRSPQERRGFEGRQIIFPSQPRANHLLGPSWEHSRTI